MALLPKPYPDELIGSVFARASRHTGLPSKRLLGSVFGVAGRSGTSFLMTSNARRVGLLCGLGPEELLQRHTVLPYTVAFMPPDAQATIRTKALQLDTSKECLGSLTKVVSHGVPFKRVCPQCIKDDLQNFGESYWRRSHHLPGVLRCQTHGTRLRNTPSPLRGAAISGDLFLPHEVAGQASIAIRMGGEVEALHREASLAALQGEVCTQEDWNGSYRAQALRLGYALPSGDVSSLLFSRTMERTFGRTALAHSGCSIGLSRNAAWPSLMLRSLSGLTFAAPKHVLMQSFLAAKIAATTDVKESYKPPGKTSRDYFQVDGELETGLRKLVADAETGQYRTTVAEMLQKLHAQTTYKHNRLRLPRTAAFIDAFRLSDVSERQIGLREKWRKRLPARAAESEAFRDRFNEQRVAERLKR